MNYSDIQKLKQKLFFSINDLCELFNIKNASARVLCSRYVKKNIFIRLKKNFYVLEQNWEYIPGKDFFRISNFLQVPSYISLMTALSYYEVTTQVQQKFFENVSLKRSKQIEIKGVEFHFYKLKKQYYFDFIKQDNMFIASREKALMDAIYLYSFGKYKMDFSSIDFDKFDAIKIKNISKIYPPKTRKIVNRLCRT